MIARYMILATMMALVSMTGYAIGQPADSPQRRQKMSSSRRILNTISKMTSWRDRSCGQRASISMLKSVVATAA